ncbi:MAG: hypothetical protein IJ562_07345 [Prevotella sp.]|nr:hypothetical protein [Prevotella sp.]
MEKADSRLSLCGPQDYFHRHQSYALSLPMLRLVAFEVMLHNLPPHPVLPSDTVGRALHFPNNMIVNSCKDNVYFSFEQNSQTKIAEMMIQNNHLSKIGNKRQGNKQCGGEGLNDNL